MLTLLLAYVLTWFLVQQAQTYLIAEELRPSKRPLNLWLIQSALITILFLSSVLITYRPWLAVILSLAIAAIFLVVNQAKYHALAEPLVFSDIYLYLQVFTHPRLFLPFLNIPITLTAIVSGLGLIGLAISIEPTLQLPRLGFSLINTIGLLLLIIITLKAALKIKLAFDPKQDIQTLGFFNSLFIYFIQANQRKNLNELYALINAESPFQADVQPALARPDIIVVQSESFFDVRHLTPAINSNVLKRFDSISASSRQAGRLVVPAWGANTLRSEYAFLSGISNQKLAYYRFNPYQFLQQQPSPTLASQLKKAGYRCICIHPNHAQFFKRDTVFPLFGFDEFIDIEQFKLAKRIGPYISDQAVVEKIIDVLQAEQDSKPLFIFAITMENHGPLHLEDGADSDLELIYTAEPPPQHHDLTIYLKHLKNADQMLFDLTTALTTRSKENLLCWYGDHIPSMPTIYKALNFKDGRSDYLLWSNRANRDTAKQQDLSIEQLGIDLLTLAGIGIADKG